MKLTRKILILSVIGLFFIVTGYGQGEAKPVWEMAKEGDARDLPSPPKPSKQYTIGVVVPHLANPHFISMAYGFFSEGEALGAKVILFEAGGYTKLDRQLQQVEDLLAMPVDALILVPVNFDGSKPMVASAVAKKVPVINVNVMTAAQEVATRIRSDDEEIGRMHAEYMGKKLNGEGKVLILAGPAGASWAVGRSKGFEEYMAKHYPNIKIVAKRWLNSDPAAGMKEMEDALQVYPDLNGVMTGSDFLGVGAAQAIFAAGKSEKIVLTTTDSQDDTIKGIKEGKISATVVQSSVYMGQWGIRAAIMTLEGKADQLVKRYWTPLTILDKTNVDTFKLEEIARPPAGWKMPK